MQREKYLLLLEKGEHQFANHRFEIRGMSSRQIKSNTVQMGQQYIITADGDLAICSNCHAIDDGMGQSANYNPQEQHQSEDKWFLQVVFHNSNMSLAQSAVTTYKNGRQLIVLSANGNSETLHILKKIQSIDNLPSLSSCEIVQTRLRQWGSFQRLYAGCLASTVRYILPIGDQIYAYGGRDAYIIDSRSESISAKLTPLLYDEISHISKITEHSLECNYLVLSIDNAIIKLVKRKCGNLVERELEAAQIIQNFEAISQVDTLNSMGYFVRYENHSKVEVYQKNE